MSSVGIISKIMKSKWNVDPQSAITIARLLGHLERVSYIMDCLDDGDAYNYINNLKEEYYKEYFRRKKTEKELSQGGSNSPPDAL